MGLETSANALGEIRLKHNAIPVAIFDLRLGVQLHKSEITQPIASTKSAFTPNENRISALNATSAKRHVFTAVRDKLKIA